MIETFRSKALKRFWTKGDAGAVRADWRGRVRIILAALDAAERPENLDLPGLGFHPLTGDMAGRFSLTVSRNWRITFGWADGNAIEIDMEDYHGR